MDRNVAGEAGASSDVVRREQVTDDQGRRWVEGELDADTYFRQARTRARQMARQSVAKRLDAPGLRLRPAR
ncbi:hypothetical protein CLV35_3934 [Motilibacter peucedani]|uniref:Uncharacterized protein n=1 Tax=Motilibacter peucedani TaxID=598650 RepID=A0A420XKR2_9ACTN|nr:hypothetical protein [Motilibacter peucedani]RKS68027.1 hypothetical protein CLV35_3934 [Motilibacter peucedani]